MEIKDLKMPTLFYAPMEGVTDEHFRDFLFHYYPEWDYFSTDFLRIPSQGIYPKKQFINHFGKESFYDSEQRAKTLYQVLTSTNALNYEHLQIIKELGIKWLDLNLGCPSKTVCKHGGGSYLLSDLECLGAIIKLYREEYKDFFSVKIRLGFEDDHNFEALIKSFNDWGVDQITIHGRTRTQMYKGVSSWGHIKKAVKWSDIPIVGNGDIWNSESIENFVDYTGCESIMLARPALKSPWLAKDFKQGLRKNSEEEFRARMEFCQNFIEFSQSKNIDEGFTLKKLKAVSRHWFDDIPAGATIKRSFLLSKELPVMEEVIHQYL